jgi:hypothetical protein
MEPQFADFPAEVAGVRLAEGVGLLGEQADEEVGAAEVSVAEALESGPDLGLDLYCVQPCHASDGICIGCYGNERSPIGLAVTLTPCRRPGCSWGGSRGCCAPVDDPTCGLTGRRAGQVGRLVCPVQAAPDKRSPLVKLRTVGYG